MTDLGTLGGNNSVGLGVNNRGQVVGHAENAATDPTCTAPQLLHFEPFLSEKGGMQELPPFPGDPDGEAVSINDNGQAVGGTGNCIVPFHAVLWQDGVVSDLGSLGGTIGEALRVNDQGQVVGLTNLPGDMTHHPFLWQNGVMTDLGTLLPGDVFASAHGINSKVQVVGGSGDASGNLRPFLWRDGVMTDLNTLIPAGSPLFLLCALAPINSRGQIAGSALQTSTGEVHAFLATPSSRQRERHACRTGRNSREPEGRSPGKCSQAASAAPALRPI